MDNTNYQYTGKTYKDYLKKITIWTKIRWTWLSIRKRWNNG